MIATMIGVIITVRITTATSRLVPESWITNWTDSLRSGETRLLPTYGASTRIPISP